MPPKPIADAFGKIAVGTMSLLKQRDEESKTLTVIRDALLPKLLSGEIAVEGPGKCGRGKS